MLCGFFMGHTVVGMEFGLDKHAVLVLKIVPLVVGCLGVMSGLLEGFLKDLGILDVLGEVQAYAVIGTILILQKMLSLQAPGLEAKVKQCLCLQSCSDHRKSRIINKLPLL